MITYIFPFLYLLALSFFEKYIGKKLFILNTIGLVFLVLFAGLRYEVDKDYINYIYFFDLIPTLFDSQQLLSEFYFEPIFQILVSIIKTFLPVEYIFIIVAAISIANYEKVFRKELAIPSAAILIYYADAFLVREFTQMRFGLAVSFSVLAIYYYRVEENKKYLIFGIISAFIHYVCFVIFLLPIWMKFTKSKKHILIISTLLFFLSLSGLLLPLTQIFSQSSIAPERIQHYSTTSDGESAQKIYIIIHYFIFLLIYYYIKKNNNEKLFFYFKVFSLSFFLLCLFSEFDLMRRLSFVFSTSIYLIYATMYKENKLIPTLLIFTYYTSLLVYSRFAILEPYAYNLNIF